MPPQSALGNTCQKPTLFQSTTDWGIGSRAFFTSIIPSPFSHWLRFTYSPGSLTVTSLKMCRSLSSASYVNSYKLLIYGFYRYENELRATQCPCHNIGRTNISPFYWHFGCGTSQQTWNIILCQQNINVHKWHLLAVFTYFAYVVLTVRRGLVHNISFSCFFSKQITKKDKRIFSSDVWWAMNEAWPVFFFIAFFSINFVPSTPIQSEFLFLVSLHPSEFIIFIDVAIAGGYFFKCINRKCIEIYSK